MVYNDKGDFLMKKKEIVIIVLLLVIAGGLYFFLKPNVNQDKAKIVVMHNDQAIDMVDINVNDIYEYEGDYGTLHLEVKDGKWRAIDVECPTQECVHVGWVSAEEYWPIVCLPNGFALVLEDN